MTPSSPSPRARALFLLLLLGLPGPAAAAGEAGLDPRARPGPEDAAPALPADPRAAAALFARPEIEDETRRAAFLIGAGAPQEAAAILDRLIARHPDLPLPRVNRAALAMLTGDPEFARLQLEAAMERGYPAGALRDDPILAPLAPAPVLAAPPGSAPEPAAFAPVAAPVAGQTAPVGPDNTGWNPETGRLEPRFAFPASSDAPVLPPRPETAAYDLLREHVRRDRAAGNHGDLYDNRDRGHSALERAAHPQLAHVTYAPAAQAADLDYGLNDRLLFDRPTIGNSSTAITAGPHWRSLPRHALTRPDGAGPMRLWQTAAANHVYVHPAHRDFGGDHGDLFPANAPYLLVSRGSSGSDRPVLEALALILAAFRPDAKARMIEAGLVNSTIQMVFRRSLQNVRSRESYLSGAAHPAAFDAGQINLARMVSLANAIRADALPAEARIAVLEETEPFPGVEIFGDGLSERLLDTPRAVARVWRGTAARREMIVSSGDSRDANGRPLTFDWRLLQGDPDKVRIEPLDGGLRARITLDWHDPFPVSDEDPQLTSRVDIGLFAHNGVHDSAPAILSWSFPAHETRVHEPGPDGTLRIVSVDHAPADKAQAYADPVLHPRADWKDVYRYDPDGRLLGWTRHRPGRPAAEYTAEGARRLAPDAPGQVVAYSLRHDGAGGWRIMETDRP